MYAELKGHYPAFERVILQSLYVLNDNIGSKKVFLVLILMPVKLSVQKKIKVNSDKS